MDISLRLRAVLFGILLIGSLFILTMRVRAWTGPTASPPNNNVAAPVNVGSAGQVKAGDFATQGKLGAGTASPSSSYIFDAYKSGWKAYFHGPDGGISIGPANAGWVHIYSDNAAQPIIFNTDVYTTTNAFSSYDSDLLLKTVGTTRVTVKSASGNVGVGTASPGYKLDVNGSVRGQDVYADNWFRVNGSGGIYWQAYGGGWYMSDSTWIRSYNGRYVYMNPGFDTGGASAVGCGGGLGGGYTFRVCGVMQAYRMYDDDANYYIDSNVDSQMNTVYANAFYYRSDERLKKNIRPLEGSLEKVLKLDGVTFNWKDGSDGGKPQVGFIAQDVERVAPELVTTAPNTGMKAVDYSKVGPLLVNALKEQEQKIEAQQREIDELKAAVDALMLR